MAQRSAFSSRELVDYCFDFSSGVNAGISPIRLAKDQMASGVNTTVRGDFVRPRPKFRKIELLFPGYDPPAIQALLATGKYQGGCAYNPDNGTDSLMASISGSLLRFWMGTDTAMVTDESIPGDTDDPMADQAWMIQAEKWVIRTDGTAKNPLFYDETAATPAFRSNYGTAVTHTARYTAPWTIPAVGGTVAGVQFDDVTGLAVGMTVVHRYRGNFVVQAIVGLAVDLLNVNAAPVGQVVGVVADDRLSWVTTGTQLPPMRQMAYGMGRVWGALTDGKQFIAGDLVGGSSGQLTDPTTGIVLNRRDAVLEVTENTYLSGGGNFQVPGPYGQIQAFCFSETLDSSLGQGYLQVFTRNTVFSCNAPVDRATWQSLTNPILTESAKGGGATGQWAVTNANSDIISRSKEGLRSLTLARREDSTWGNVPISREVQPQLDRDSPDLLRFCSVVVFDNRCLITSEPVLDANRGTYWKRMVPINFDRNSSLQGKEASVYDALYWSGLNILQIIKGDFGQTERCFAFTLNNHTGEIELWEILKSADAEINDNGTRRVTWGFEAFLDFGQKDPRNRDRLRLGQAEMEVSDLKGIVDFEAYYRPDNFACWVPWAKWQECSGATKTEGMAGYRIMGLPEPSPLPCDETNNRPLREGQTFQVKFIITGQCVFKSARFGADTVPQPHWLPPVCAAICRQNLVGEVEVDT